MTEEFRKLLADSVGKDKAEIALKALTGEPSVSIRLNPAKLTECPFPDAEKVPWSPYGYILKERPSFTLFSTPDATMCRTPAPCSPAM